MLLFCYLWGNESRKDKRIAAGIIFYLHYVLKCAIFLRDMGHWRSWERV